MARTNRYLSGVRRVVSGLIAIAAAVALLQIWGVGSFAFFATELGRDLTASLTSIGVVTIVAVLVWEVANSLIERQLSATDEEGEPVEHSQRARTLVPLLRKAIFALIAAVVVLMAMAELGLNITPLLAGAGVIGLAVGFGAQTLVKDVITGLFILFEDTIAVGDVVEVGGHAGLVEAISVRTIRLRDLGGIVHTVPFSQVDTVMNLTKDFSYYIFEVGIAYREDADQVIEVMKQVGGALLEDPDYAVHILEPLEILGLDRFADSAVVIKARIKTKPIRQWTVGREFNRRMKKRFDDLGIEIPFPHMTLYFGEDKQGGAPAGNVRVDAPDIAAALAEAFGRAPAPADD